MGESQMTDLQKGVLTLIRSAITGQSLPLPESFRMADACPIIHRHQIMTLAYEGAILCGVPKTEPEMQRLFQSYCQCLLQSERQLRMVKQIFTAFEAAKIDFLPLKGCNMKTLYPKPELRLMGDADILIRTEQYDAICPILEALGFTFQVESDHEYIWKSNSLFLELHKRLIPSYNKDYFRYFGDGWKLARPVEKSRYTMSRENEFIYIFCHFAKHYRDGGIGCRHVADLWVYLRNYKDLESGYLAAELKKLQLFEFYQNMRHLISVWFEDGEASEKTDFLTDTIFRSGVWGQKDDHNMAAAVKNASAAGSIQKGKQRQAFRLLFPSYSIMRQKYHILNKCPILLPILWPWRWISGLLLRPENAKTQWQQLQNTTPETVGSYQAALHYVGLDFHFKE